MQAQKDGVIISQKEIYHLVQKVVKSVDRLESNLDTRLAILEAKVEGAIQADERSRKALNLADDAIKEAKQAKETALKESKTARKIALDTRNIVMKLMVGVVTAVTTGVIGLLFYLAQKGLGE